MDGSVLAHRTLSFAQHFLKLGSLAWDSNTPACLLKDSLEGKMDQMKEIISAAKTRDEKRGFVARWDDFTSQSVF